MSSLIPEAEQEEQKKGAPRYMVAYCSIMTLLLAFFIILQAFASTQEAGLFYKGQGSFIRALETFGLGGVWDPGGGVVEGHSGPAYRAEEGQETPSETRRIDAELEEARRALAVLADLYPTEKPEGGTGWRVAMPLPVEIDRTDPALLAEEQQFLQILAARLEPMLLARGFVVRLGVIVRCSAEQEAERALAALKRAETVRTFMLDNMDAASRDTAARRLYTFSRRIEATGAAEAEAARLRLDILLTKPKLKELKTEEPGENDGEVDQ